MTERESAHPGSCDIPAELVTGNNDEKSKSINEISVPKKIPISNRLSRVNLASMNSLFMIVFGIFPIYKLIIRWADESSALIAIFSYQI